MAKVIVQHEQDSGIAVILETVPVGATDRAPGTYGRCTQCGWGLHRWLEVKAIANAKGHIEKHESAL